jgi:hypothetical protein
MRHLPIRGAGPVDALISLFDANALIAWAATILLIVILGIAVLRLNARLNRLMGQYQRLMRGSTSNNLADVLDGHLARVEAATQLTTSLEARCDQLDAHLDQAIQNIGIVRFNPFSDSGGDQSFSVALLDARGDGLVVTSYFGRAESRIFAKPVTRGQSKYQLTEEEQAAIEQAGDRTALAR